ncbi:hypothetical protein ASPZODRAFT_1320345 [Penicilliopsis zonata CBS 506.65]|uniref:CRIB domain-containing protein n=1 Tax=Penicilliopsis zonata CBS 506.65 TaxID=1073090 RepID=A0A1L9SNN0_9EURO|nr:hypothetical protein ASPZODRAFT_1320345 [Penicilliopsis zonata CBS 506.65]OJJ48798.1 hypothetical protein ASPZODRAFT_1320345 [Penicilliopsis zonata CBS 506.65]
MHVGGLPVSSVHRAAATQWPEERDPGERPSTRGSNEHSDHSGHLRSRSTAHTQSPKRLSVFSARSRSNTTTSTTSSRRSPVSSITSIDASSIPSTHEERTGSAFGSRNDKQESVTKSILTRGSRILRRQGSKFNIVATLDEEDEGDRERSKFEVSEIFNRSHKSRQTHAHEQLKRLISEPFDFHHLTHTSPSQFQSLDRARETDLVTEFSVIRASQRPETALKGIRAENLHSRECSSEDLTKYGVATLGEEASVDPSVPLSPSRGTFATRRDSARVVENFSRPGTRHVKSFPAPPNTSKLAASPDIPEPAPRVIDEILGMRARQIYPEDVYATEKPAGAAPLSPLSLEAMMFVADEEPIGTAASDCAGTTRSSLNAHPSDLEDVPEEDEVTYWHDSPEANVRTSPSPVPTHLRKPSLPPSILKPKSRLSVFVADELSKKFESLGSPTLPQCRLFQEPSPSGSEEFSGKSSVNMDSFENISECWDDDIDYCYEHAAEADCDFDWLRESFEEQERPVIQASKVEATEMMKNEQPRLLNPIRLGPSDLPTSDLDPSPNSARSPHTVETPSTGVALGKQIPQETLYEEFLEVDGASDRHFSFCSPATFHSIEQPVSPRSSFSPISKCNSQESFMLSRAASIVRKHRSSVSTTSVPELVHSSTSSREYMMPESMSSFEQLIPPTPASGRPTSIHRQTKSLAPDIENHIIFRKGSNASFDTTDMGSSTASLTHDRVRSSSEIEVRDLHSARQPSSLKGTSRGKGRASYSLFPTS